MTKNIVGYIRGTCESSLNIQKNIIIKFTHQKRIPVSKFFCDQKPCKRCIGDVEKAAKLGLDASYRQEKFFPAWEALLEQILKRNISTILVDNKFRLAISSKAFSYLMKLCKEYEVQICEVKIEPDGDESALEDSAIVYHFSNTSLERPCIIEKDVDEIYKWAFDHDVNISGLYLDFSLLESEKVQKKQMIKEVKKYKKILLIDFYHFETKTGTFFRQIKELRTEGVDIVGIRDGILKNINSKWMKRSIKVAVYVCASDQKCNGRKDILEDIFSAFVKLRTNWTITQIYRDQIGGENQKRPEFERLVADRNEYDVVIVDSMSAIAYRTAKFIQRLKELNKPVFSLKEGGVTI